jgi:hypothetical protein
VSEKETKGFFQEAGFSRKIKENKFISRNSMKINTFYFMLLAVSKEEITPSSLDKSSK